MPSSFCHVYLVCHALYSLCACVCMDVSLYVCGVVCIRNAPNTCEMSAKLHREINKILYAIHADCERHTCMCTCVGVCVCVYACHSAVCVIVVSAGGCVRVCV